MLHFRFNSDKLGPATPEEKKVTSTEKDKDNEITDDLFSKDRNISNEDRDRKIDYHINQSLFCVLFSVYLNSI